jgi:hypothetical protein
MMPLRSVTVTQAGRPAAAWRIHAEPVEPWISALSRSPAITVGNEASDSSMSQAPPRSCNAASAGLMVITPPSSRSRTRHRVKPHGSAMLIGEAGEDARLRI